MAPDGRDVTQLIAEARLSALSMEQHAATVHAERLLMVSAHQMRSTAAQLRKLATALTEAGEREGELARDLVVARDRVRDADHRLGEGGEQIQRLHDEMDRLRSQLSEREAALRTLRLVAYEAMRMNSQDQIRGNTIKTHKLLMALAGSMPGYRADIDAAHAVLTPAKAEGEKTNG